MTSRLILEITIEPLIPSGKPDYRTAIKLLGRTRREARSAFEFILTEQAHLTLKHLRNPHLLLKRGQSMTEGIKALGKELFSLIFPADSQTLALWESIRQSDLQIRFRLPAALREYPWEALYDGADFIAMEYRTPVMRLLTELPMRQISPIAGDLRVLYVSASPALLRRNQPLVKLDIEQTANALREVLDPGTTRRRKRRAVLHHDDVLLDATKKELQRKLQGKERYHIICFAGHGIIETNDSSILLSEKEEDHAQSIATPLTAQDLARWCQKQTELRLLYLMACNTATPTTSADAPIVQSVSVAGDNPPTANAASISNTDPTVYLTGFAQAFLAKSTIAAVVAMQSEVGDKNMRELTASFFAQLAAEQPIDLALTEARKTLRRSGPVGRDTIAPVLYLRSDQTRLFQPDHTVRNIVRSSIAVIMVLVVLLGGLQVLNWIEQRREQVRQDRRFALERESRVETIAQISNTFSVPIDGLHNSMPLLAFGSLWTMADNGSPRLLRLDTDGRIADSVELPASGKALVTGGAYLWMMTDQSMIYRLSPQSPDLSPVSIALRRPADSLIYAEGALWAISRQDQSVTWVSGIEPDVALADNGIPELPIGLGAQLSSKRIRLGTTATPFTGGGYLWSYQSGRSDLIRVSAADGSAAEFDVKADIFKADYDPLANQIVVLASVRSATSGSDRRETVERLTIDPNSGTVVQRAVIEADSSLVDLIVMGGRMWLAEGIRQSDTAPSESVTTGVMLYSEGAPSLQLPSRPYRTFIEHEYLWIVTDNDTLYRVSLSDWSIQQSGVIGRLRDYSNAVSDGLRLWITIPAENQIMLIDEQTLSTVNSFSPCDLPFGPRFDGTSMWVTCGREQRLLQVPASIRFVSTDRFAADQQTQVPLHDLDGRLWLVQEQAGRVVVVEQGEVPLVVLEVESALSPLIWDGSAFWTSTQSPGRVYRLTPQVIEQSVWLDMMSSARFSPEVRQYDVPGQLQAIRVLKQNEKTAVWITYYESIVDGEAPNVAVIDARTMEKVQSISAGRIPLYVALIEDRVWVMGVTDEGTKVQIFNSADQPAVEMYTVDETGLWSPVLVNHQVWFSAGAPSLQNAMDTIFNSCDQLRDGLYRFDPSGKEIVPVVRTNGLPSVLSVNDTMIWYESAALRSIAGEAAVVGDQQGATGGCGVFGYNTRTGEQYGPFAPCTNTRTPYLSGRFVWVGCRQAEQRGTLPALWLIDQHDGRVIRKIPEAGENPWLPLEINECTWIVFQNSDRASVFNQEGELLGSYRTGRSPGAPFLHLGAAWVYNAGDGTLQQLGSTAACPTPVPETTSG